MKEEEKKDEKHVEGVEGKGMDFGMTENGGNKPAEGGEKGDDDKDKPVIGGGSSGFPVEKWKYINKILNPIYSIIKQCYI